MYVGRKVHADDGVHFGGASREEDELAASPSSSSATSVSVTEIESTSEETSSLLGALPLVRHFRSRSATYYRFSWCPQHFSCALLVPQCVAKLEIINIQVGR